MTKKLSVVLAVSALALAGALIAGCGDDDEGGDATEAASVSADDAIAEIGEVRTGIDAALAAYRDGDSEEAVRLTEDAYLEHFELVEGPLEEVEPELNEELEETIREGLPAEFEREAPVNEIGGLVDAIHEDLDTAEQALNAEG